MVEYKNNKYSQAWVVAPVQTTTCPAVIYVKDAKSGAKSSGDSHSRFRRRIFEYPCHDVPRGSKSRTLIHRNL